MTEGKTAKTTNAGWPDPNEWVNRLYQQLAERQAVYDDEKDDVLKRNKAAAMLGVVLRSLMEFPAFKNSSVHLPLKDLMQFISDLEMGRDHEWSKTVSVSGTNISTTAKDELKSWVRVIYEMLRSNNFKAVEAYEHIANILTKSGRTGRDKLEPVRWRLVQSWCREKGNDRDALIRGRLENWLADLNRDLANAEPVGGSSHQKKDRSKALAAELADVCLNLPHLRDRFFPVG